MKAPLHLFPTSPAVQHRVRQTGSSRFPGARRVRGENEPYGALLTYSLNLPGLPHPDDEAERQRKEEEREKELARRREAPAPEAGEEVPAAGIGEPPAGAPEGKPGEGPQATIEVRDAAGTLLRTFKGPAKLGVNRAVWDLTIDAAKSPPTETPSGRPPTGPEVPPGIYQVTVKQGDHEATGQVEVAPDPRRPFDAEARRANWEALRRTGRLQDRTTEAVERVRRAAADLDTLLARTKPQEKESESAEAKARHDAHKELAKEGKRLKKELEKLEARLWEGPDTKGILPPDDAMSQIQNARRFLGSSWDRPTPAQTAYLAEAEATLQAVLAEVNKFFAEDLPAFRKQLQDSDLRLLQELPPLEIPAE